MTKEFKIKYFNLINYRMSINPLPQNEEYHKHHIIPKFLKPKKNKLVRLTPQEHCLAHYYLYNGYKNNRNKKFVNYLYSAYKGLLYDNFICLKQELGFRKRIESEILKSTINLNHRYIKEINQDAEVF